MSDPIKNEDLCDRCKYGAYSEACAMGSNCENCPMGVLGGIDRCRCSSIEQNTPCPLFEEAETNETD